MDESRIREIVREEIAAVMAQRDREAKAKAVERMAYDAINDEQARKREARRDAAMLRDIEERTRLIGDYLGGGK